MPAHPDFRVSRPDEDCELAFRWRDWTRHLEQLMKDAVPSLREYADTIPHTPDSAQPGHPTRWCKRCRLERQIQVLEAGL